VAAAGDRAQPIPASGIKSQRINLHRSLADSKAGRLRRAFGSGEALQRVAALRGETTGGVGSRAATSPTEEFLTVWPVTTFDWRRGHFLT